VSGAGPHSLNRCKKLKDYLDGKIQPDKDGTIKRIVDFEAGEVDGEHQ